MNKTNYYNLLQMLVGLRNSALGSKIIKEEMTDKELFKEILQISKEDITNNKLCEKVKLRFILDRIIESANKQLSCYRQRKEDLIARMATDWPKWGCGVDFYTFFILPFIKNPLLLHFINLSENVDLSKIIFKSGYYEANGKITYIEENIKFNNNTIKADAVDLAIDPVTQSYKLNTEFITKNRRPFLVRVRDADIGVQAFFSLLEGIMRNSAKHGIEEDKFDIRIIFFENAEMMKIFLNTNIQTNQIDNEDKKYCYVLISINRDLISVNDKRRKVGDKELIEFLSDSLKEPIIDDSTGELMPGKWGLKEIKICAAFLSGADISEVNSKEPKFIVVDKNKILWNDKERLTFILKLEKPRYVLAVVPSSWNIDKKEWLANGVKIVNSNEEFEDKIINDDTDYDFLYIDNSFFQQLEQLIQKYQNKLPQRIINNNLTSDGNFKTFILSVFDLYLETLLVGNDFKFIIYFGSEYKNTEDINKWSKIGCDYNFAFPSKPEDIFNGNEEKQIFIVSHKKINNIFTNAEENLRINNHKKAYYFQHASHSDPFFSFLRALNPEIDDFHSRLVLRQVVESSFMNIMIIDERIAQSLLNMKSPDEPEITLREKLYWMGIYVAQGVKVCDDNVIYWIPKEEYFDIPKKRTCLINLEDIINQDKPLKIDEQEIHILIIHLTRFNEIFDKVKNIYNKKDDFVKVLKKKVKHVIVHSGRGNTKGDMPSNTPFLEYSIVQKYILQEPSKFYLTQIALNTKGDG